MLGRGCVLFGLVLLVISISFVHIKAQKSCKESPD